jgi:hypothetical protein
MTDLSYRKPEVFKRFGGTGSVPGGNMKYKVTWSGGVARRSRPSTQDSHTGLTYPFGSVVDVAEENIPDAEDPTNPDKVWVKFPDGYYGASEYPRDDGTPAVRMVKVEETTKKVVKGVIYYDDGTSDELFPKE